MRLVDSPSELSRVAADLASARTLYLDTEFDSGRGDTLLCLLQISGGASIHLVDTLRLSSLEALRPVLADPEREWVVHAGAQDVALLMDRLGLPGPPKVFDTQVAWALVSPEHSVSLAYLRFVLLGVRSGKSHQADDWKRRPLPQPQLAYAAQDIEDLPRLRAELGKRLAASGRERFVHAASLEAVTPSIAEPDPLSLEGFRNAWQLDVHSQAALRWLITWYNELSPKERAGAPDAKTLLAIAGRMPRSADDLARIKGVPRRFAAGSAERIVRELARAAAGADAGDFVPIDPPPYATFEEIRLDGLLARARAEVAVEVGVAPELALPGRLLKRLRAHVLRGNSVASAADELEGWRGELLGEAWRRIAGAQQR